MNEKKIILPEKSNKKMFNIKNFKNLNNEKNFFVSLFAQMPVHRIPTIK